VRACVGFQLSLKAELHLPKPAQAISLDLMQCRGVF
jgi:hypothetical protein